MRVLPETHPDLILYGGRVVTFPGGPVVSALAVAGDKVAAVGRDDDVLNLAGPGTRRVNLGGRVVLPGFTDGHLHLSWLGENLTRLDLSACRRLDELLARVQEWAGAAGPGRWVLGWGWHQDKLAERRPPGREELDRAAPDRPVLLVRACTHAAVANSAALRLAGISRETPDPPGGRIGRHPSGEPSGLLEESAVDLVRRVIPAPSGEEREEQVLAACREAVRHGITSAHTNDTGCAQVYWRLYRRGLLPLRIYLDESKTPAELAHLECPTGWGNPWLRTGAVKFYADGAFGPRTAALREPYADDSPNSGMLLLSPGDLAAGVEAAHRAGRQVAIHALGDRAVEVAVEVLERANPPGGSPWRDRIVHCGLMDPRLLVRIRQARLVVDAQPSFIPLEVDWIPGRVGPGRQRWTYAYGSLAREGVVVTAGSDAPVTPLNPFLGVYGAVCRQDTSGYPPGGWVPAERVSVVEALKMYTVNGAYASFSEDEKGSLTPGKLADLVVLFPDPFTSPPEDLVRVHVLATVVGGRVMYVSPRAADLAEQMGGPT